MVNNVHICSMTTSFLPSVSSIHVLYTIQHNHLQNEKAMINYLSLNSNWNKSCCIKDGLKGKKMKMLNIRLEDT